MMLINIINEVSDEYLLGWTEQFSQLKVSKCTQDIPPSKNHSLSINLDLLFFSQASLARPQLPCFNFRAKLALDSESQTLLLMSPTLWAMKVTTPS